MRTPLLCSITLVLVLAAPVQAAPRIGQTAGNLAVADLNRDGNADLLVAGGKGRVVRLGDGAGGFRAPTGGTSIPIGQEVVADVDRDGRPDLVGFGGAGQVVTYKGDGTGRFRKLSAVRLRVGDAFNLLVGRFDGRPGLDVLTTDGRSSAELLSGDDRGRFREAPGSRKTDCPSCDHVAAADVTGDGFTDLVGAIGNGGGGLLTLRGGAADGRLPRIAKARTGRYNEATTLADLDGDGKLDAAVAVPGAGRVDLLRGDGRGTFTRVAPSPKLLPAPARLAPGDVDGDGDIDLAVRFRNDATVQVLLNDGRLGLTLGPRLERQEPRASGPGPIALADVDGDGRADLVAAKRDGTTLLYLAGEGATFAAPVAVR